VRTAQLESIAQTKAWALWMPTVVPVVMSALVEQLNQHPHLMEVASVQLVISVQQEPQPSRFVLMDTSTQIQDKKAVWLVSKVNIATSKTTTRTHQMMLEEIVR
jgi:hypothetical protein